MGHLNKTQINNLLCSQVIGRLAITDGKNPYILPITYAFDGEYIYCHTNSSSKLNMLRKNPSVCFEVDMMTDLHNRQSVILKGKFEELDDPKLIKAKALILNRVFPLRTTMSYYPQGYEMMKSVEVAKPMKEIIYRIKIEKISGEFEKY